MGVIGFFKRLFGITKVVLQVATSPTTGGIISMFSPQIYGVIVILSKMMKEIDDTIEDNGVKDNRADTYARYLLAREGLIGLKERDVKYIKVTALKMAKGELKVHPQ
jgi:hypothetical protein